MNINTYGDWYPRKPEVGYPGEEYPFEASDRCGHLVQETPPELWSNITGYLSIPDKLRLMQVAQKLHDVAADSIYKILYIHGSRGRRCCAMLASDTSLSRFYTSLVRSIVFYGIDVGDRQWTFPIFARILPKLENVHTLRIQVHHRYSDVLLNSLERYGIVRQAGPPKSLVMVSFHVGNIRRSYTRPHHLPLLQTITIKGNASLLPIAAYRPIGAFEVTAPLSGRDLASVIKCFDTDTGRHSLTSLDIHLRESVVLVNVLLKISDTFPELKKLSIGQKNLTVQAVLRLLGNDKSTLTKLTTLRLTQTGICSTYWWCSASTTDADRLILPVLDNILSGHHAFETLDLGTMTYTFDGSTFKSVEIFKHDPNWNIYIA
ncbi:hypothetical protein DFP72DRAFT_1071749 [Ephemerocybe angulata]|uniref:F-box domain-containing protein n=1 Tax=Ephemerocybe angulata TaxID=980116 RepID=A0A8H6M4I4_9AGAR|nr:hypothetical protein DFP72DRAFT_1071749 [Tulosesus angulatus]